MKYLSWIFILSCITLGVGGLLAKEYGEALQFFLLAGLLIEVVFGRK